MSLKQSKLLGPFKLRELELKNRGVMAPMTRGLAGENRIPNALMAKYYLQRVSSGLNTTEATTISEKANGWVQPPGIYTDSMAAGWHQVVDTVHDKGGTIFLQLCHCLRTSFHRLSGFGDAICQQLAAEFGGGHVDLVQPDPCKRMR